MSALDDYKLEKQARGITDAIVDDGSMIALADAAIEGLKCCGNCRWSEWDDVPHVCYKKPTGVGWDSNVVTPADGCRFNPSRWEDFWGAE